MFIDINLYYFIDSFLKSTDYSNKFSREGLITLFNYLKNLEQELNENIEFDIVSIACDFEEYSNLNEFKENYNIKVNNIKDIENYTQVIQIENKDSFIIEVF